MVNKRFERFKGFNLWNLMISLAVLTISPIK